MLARTNSQFSRLLVLYAALAWGGVFSMASPSFAALMPAYETAAGIDAQTPVALALDRRGYLYVVESGGHQLSMYDRNGVRIKTLEGLDRPRAIAVGARGRLYVADKSSVEIYGARSLKPLGRLDAGEEAFIKPTAVTTDSRGRIYVADAKAGVVQVFNPDKSPGFSFGAPGTDDGQFQHPVSILVDEAAGEILVLDFGPVAGRIQVFGLDGAFKRSFETKGAGGMALKRPMGLVMDEHGRLYVSDAYSSQLAVYDGTGAYLGGLSAEDAPLRNPLGMAYAARRGRLYVASINNARVTAFDIFNRSPGPGGPPAVPEPDGTAPDGQAAPSAEAAAPAGEEGTDCGGGCTAPGGGATPDDTVEVNAAPFLEVGRVQADHRWRPVSFRSAFTDPVVIAKVASRKDPAPVVVRIRNLTPAGFEVRLQEWDYLDGDHARENLTYLAVERGAHQLADGAWIQAGHIDNAGARTWRRITFARPLGQTPVILAAVQSLNETDAVTVRLRRAGPDGFDCRLQEQESNPRRHAGERIGYIAWPPSGGTLGGLLFEAANAADPVNHRFRELPLTTGFPHEPAILAGLQSANGGDTASLRLRHTGVSKVALRVEEEQSRDKETWHVGETAGYLAFGVSLADPAADSDGDGIPDLDEIDLYGLQPLARDTDEDGLADGQERAYWGGAWNLDYDGDGLVNLLDGDADGDGHLDGLERALGTDPADPLSTP